MSALRPTWLALPLWLVACAQPLRPLPATPRIEPAAPLFVAAVGLKLAKDSGQNAVPEWLKDEQVFWAKRFASEALRELASKDIGSAIGANQLRARTAGEDVLVEIESAEGPESALARCHAVVRAAETMARALEPNTLPYLRAELARNRAELHKLEEAQKRERAIKVPGQDARTPADAIAAVKVSLRQLAASQGQTPDAIRRELVQEPTRLAALHAEQRRAATEALVLMRGGLGEQHPNVQAQRTQERWYAQRIVLQHKAEVAFLRRFLSRLETRRRGGIEAIAVAKLEAQEAELRLPGTDSDQPLASSATPELQELADRYERAALNAHEVSARLGPNHPRRLALEVAVGDAGLRLTKLRLLTAAMLGAELARAVARLPGRGRQPRAASQAAGATEGDPPLEGNVASQILALRATVSLLFEHLDTEENRQRVASPRFTVTAACKVGVGSVGSAGR